MSVKPIPVPVQGKQGLLHNRGFCLLWIGNTISWTGDQFYLVALPWLVLSLTSSSVVLGTIAMLAAIPRAVLMLLGGAVSDRVSPQRILILTALVRAALVMAIPALLFLKMLQVRDLYFLAFGFGLADAFSYPAGSAILPFLVEHEQLPAANSISQATQQITTLVAPGPAGLFIRAFGNAWAFLLDGLSFFVMIAALLGLRDQPPAISTPPQDNMLQAIVEGLCYIQTDVPLRSLLLVIAVLNFALSGPMTVGLAVIAKHKFGTASTFGLLISSFAAGSLAGMLGAGVTRHRRRGLILLLASGVVGLCVAFLGSFHSITGLAIDLFAISGAVAFESVELVAWVQQRVEPALMGRVMSLLMFASVGLTPFSLAIAGFTLKASVSGTFVVAGAMILLVTLLAASHHAVRAID